MNRQTKTTANDPLRVPYVILAFRRLSSEFEMEKKLRKLEEAL